MRLVLLGRRKWTVYVVCSERGDCPVLDTLSQCGNAGVRLLSDLREYVPTHGPGFNEEFSKALRDHILEFRQPTARGGTPRVLYFYARNHVIVCAVALLKKGGKIPNALIEEAIALRERYLQARDRNELLIDGIDDAEE